MGKLGQVLGITGNMLRQERGEKRVVMGFLLGIALIGWRLQLFLKYAAGMGEPVNVLEAFVVVAHLYKNMLFLPLGWLLLVADAPFVKGNAYLVLHRCGRKVWNLGMLLYIAVQAFLYAACLALVSVLASSPLGFAGNMWSSPVYDLAMGWAESAAMEAGIDFSWPNILEAIHVPEAFFLTLLFLWLYLMMLGMLLYVCTLLMKEIFAILAAFGVQIGGFLLQEGMSPQFSLLSKSVLGYSVDGNGGEWKTALLFVGILLILTGISLCFIGRVDFQLKTEEE